MSATQSISTGGVSTGTQSAACHCPQETPPPPCCCNLVCFDRPNYFCGHMLTDADLTLQQRYVVEKSKLYHRTLDGHGVVCGLKLTCDCDCKGHVRIHDGFAIDDCGNDLVVCEPVRFDVIARLKSKNLLVTDPEQEDCEPRRQREHCEIRQCFYVTICYEEKEYGYETPFQSSCTAGPKQCMPTRIHEGVRFDVTDKLPVSHSYLETLEKRIQECFQLNCDSPIGVILREHAQKLLAVFGTGGERQQGFDHCELFCRLRAYFLNHLKVRPDPYNCKVYEEVACLSCPRYERSYEDRSEEHERYMAELRDAFTKLLYHMQRYQYDCVLGDLVFECCQPCEPHCLVLGTVEVLNGELVRVCNTPRQYLWAPANLLQVLTFEILTGKWSGQGPVEEHGVRCCPPYDRFEPVQFLREFSISECGRRYAAEAALESFREIGKSLHNSFDFTDSGAFAPRLFAELLDRSKQEKEAGLKDLGVSASIANTPAAALKGLNPMQALMSKMLLRRGDTVVGYKSEEGVRVLPDFLGEISPDRSMGAAVEAGAQGAAHEVAQLREQLEALRKKVEELEEAQKPAPKKRT